MYQTAWTYPAREHYKNAYFLWLYNSTPTWFKTNFLQHDFDAWLQKMCDAAVPDIPLHWYKLNWHITCDLPENWTVPSGAFLFLLGICGLSLVYQWIICGLSLVYQWIICGLSLMYQWIIRCVILCDFIPCFEVNLFWQRSQENGFSPVCCNSWRWTWDGARNTFGQKWHW